jgi:hypothetical protein
MGGEEDPKDGGAVAGAVFGAVFIYIVSVPCSRACWNVLTCCRASSSSVDYKLSFTCARAAAVR